MIMIDLSYFETFVSNSSIGSSNVSENDIDKCKDFVSYILNSANDEEKLSIQIIILATLANSIDTKNPTFIEFNKAFINHQELREWIVKL